MSSHFYKRPGSVFYSISPLREGGVSHPWQLQTAQVRNRLLGFLTDLRYSVNIQPQIAFFTDACVKLLLTSSLISDRERSAAGAASSTRLLRCFMVPSAGTCCYSLSTDALVVCSHLRTCDGASVSISSFFRLAFSPIARGTRACGYLLSIYRCVCVHERYER